MLKDIESHSCDRVVCLGDIIGYGPNPRECLDLVMKMDLCVIGNHDYGAVHDPEGFSSTAEQAIFWTRQQIETGETPEDTKRRLLFLMKLPRIIKEDEVLFLHGSIRNPINEYVFPEEAWERRKMERLFSMIPRYCFQGHTHQPGIFTPEPPFLTPDEINYRIKLDFPKAMINVGSVGQPRDDDPRASYMLYDYEQRILLHRRVAYDIARAQARFKKAGLPVRNAKRIASGE